MKMGKLKDHYFDEINNDDDGYDKYVSELEIARAEAEYHIDAYYEKGMEIKELFDHIWYASTEILPKLEVQVIIDKEDNLFVSTGSKGFVAFESRNCNIQNGIKMKIPMKCWIHTHPFGRAYFSGTDINTVTIQQLIMKEAYVLGGEGHYGYWSQETPTELQIYYNNKYEETQVWNKRSEEE